MKQPANRFENFSSVPCPGLQTGIPAKAQRVGRQSYASRGFAFRKSHATRVSRKAGSLFVAREREARLNCIKCTMQNAESASSLDFYINSSDFITRVHVHVTHTYQQIISVCEVLSVNKLAENSNFRTKLPLLFSNAIIIMK